MKRWSCACAVGAALWTTSAQAAPTQVCVEVVEKQWAQGATSAARVDAESGPTRESEPPTRTAAPPGPSAAAPASDAPAPERVSEASAEERVGDPPTPPAVQPPAAGKPTTWAAPATRAVPAVATAAPAPEAAPSLDPDRYLRRLLEYQVTHHPAYEAVESGCTERLTVELYALERGWTVFARFSQFAREEKVDRVELDEFGALADRLVRALLADTSVQETLDRENVLRADSDEDMRRVHAQTHFQLAMGTSLRLGKLPTAHGARGEVDPRLRLESPLTLSIGARNKFRGWALDPFARVQIGTGDYVPNGKDEPGGHVDFGGSGALGLHFVRYANPRGIGSLYYGGGAQFELSRYKVTEAGARGRSGYHDGLWSGGLNVDLLFGYEFMRASTLHFFVQLEASLPAYTVSGQTKSGGLDDAYLPSVVAQVGLLL